MVQVRVKLRGERLGCLAQLRVGVRARGKPVPYGSGYGLIS